MESFNPGPYFFYPFMPIHKNVEEEKKDIYYDELFSPELTLLHGNAYKNEYVPYKNYQPTIPFNKTQKDKMMMEVQMYYLISHDLTLHLDIHPKDKEVYLQYKKYAEEYVKKFREYEEKYGPLISLDAGYDGMFTWVEPSNV